MPPTYTREEVIARFKEELEAGRPLYTVGAGTGISAKFAEAGGADLITTYPIAKYRMAGRSSLAGYLPLCDSNAATLEMGEREILPVIREIPVAAGLLGSDITRDMGRLLDQVKEVGFSGVLNCPTLSCVDGSFRVGLEETGLGYANEVETIAIREASDEELALMSVERVLFLSLDEMKTVQDYFDRLGRDPTDVELETLAQTWSEHCQHKAFKSRIDYACKGGIPRVLPGGKTIAPPYDEIIDGGLFSTYLRAANAAVQPEALALSADLAKVAGAGRLFDAHESYLTAVTQSLLDRAVAEGEIAAVDTAAVAHVLAGLGREFARPEVAVIAKASPKETADAISEVILKGLLGKD